MGVNCYITVNPVYFCITLEDRPDGTSGKTSASGAGIVWALAQSRVDGHRSLVTPERVLSEYNEDLIYFIF